jgi:hypothetical protein
MTLAIGLHQMYPTNPEGSFASSGETVTWAEDFALDQPPFELVAYAWNDDDTYDHTVTVRVVIQEAAVELSLYQEIRSLLGLGGG